MPDFRHLASVSVRGTQFLLDDGTVFTPVGFNYDHDEHYRLLEDYWLNEWDKIVNDFACMRSLGATVVRIHLQTARFLDGPCTFNKTSLSQLDRLLELALLNQLRIHLVGLGCYHREDVPVWYEQLPEPTRWQVQAFFWETLATRYCGHPAIFCFDLMNEPVVPGRKRHDKGWLGPEFHGKCFVQFISLDGTQAPRTEIAIRWTQLLTDIIHKQDPGRLVTIGLVDWSLEGIEAQNSGFIPDRIAPLLDFMCAHVYPTYNNVEKAVDTVRRFCLGKPLLLDETFPLRCSVQEIDNFISAIQPFVTGFLGFYTDYVSEPITEHHFARNSLMREWIGVFRKQASLYTQCDPALATVPQPTAFDSH